VGRPGIQNSCEGAVKQLGSGGPDCPEAFRLPAALRFGEPGGCQAGSPIAKLHDNRSAAHVQLGFEVHYNTEIDERTAPAVAETLRESGMHLAMITPGAHSHFGYGGIAWDKGVRAVAVRKDDKTAAVEPTVATITDGSYPISRELYWFVNSVPTGDVSQFVNWALSEAGQKVAQAADYVPLAKEKAASSVIK